MSSDALRLYHTPAILNHFPNLIAAESTRHCGVSPVPFASLNLGINTADATDNITENRNRFFTAIGVDNWQHRFAAAHQVHGTEVLVATEAGQYEGYDALITNRAGLWIGVTVADCVPILIYDEQNQAVAAIHAGWRGTSGQIVAKTLVTMQEVFGTAPNRCYAYIGTCIDEASFEVGPEVAEQFAQAFKGVDPDTKKDCVNLKAANRQQLLDVGIPAAQIEVSSFSTVLNNNDYFSYRAEKGHTGRMLIVIGIKA